MKKLVAQTLGDKLKFNQKIFSCVIPDLHRAPVLHDWDAVFLYFAL